MSTDVVLDTVVQTNLLTVGLMTSNATANLITATSQTMALSFQNAVANQQQGYITHQSAGVQGRNSMSAAGLTSAYTIVKNLEN